MASFPLSLSGNNELPTQTESPTGEQRASQCGKKELPSGGLSGSLFSPSGETESCPVGRGRGPSGGEPRPTGWPHWGCGRSPVGTPALDVSQSLGRPDLPMGVFLPLRRSRISTKLWQISLSLCLCVAPRCRNLLPASTHTAPVSSPGSSLTVLHLAGFYFFMFLSLGAFLSLEVLEVDILWPRWVARIGVSGPRRRRVCRACLLTADRQCTELRPLLRLPRLFLCLT